MAYPVFDLHCDTASMLCLRDAPGGVREALEVPEELMPACGSSLVESSLHISVKAIGNMPWLQCFACFIPDTMDVEQAGELWNSVSTYLDAQAAEHSDALAAVRGADDAQVALASGKLGIVKTIENARLFAADPAWVHRCAQEGVCMASLSWNAQGPLASGHDVENAGLTPAGREAVRLMEEERMVLDVSHLNDTCFAEVARMAQRPFIASHSNARAVCGHPRNLTDDQFREIRDRGGLVGLNYCDDFLVDETEGREPTYDDVFAHVEHWLDLGGENVVALGSDFDGCEPPSCLADASKLGAFQERLVERFGGDITEAICGGNALRFFAEQAW